MGATSLCGGIGANPDNQTHICTEPPTSCLTMTICRVCWLKGTTNYHWWRWILWQYMGRTRR